MKKYIFLGILIISIYSCKKEYDNSAIQLKISNLVVECTITNEPPPYEAKLSWSLPYNSLLIKNAASNAEIIIHDDLGNSEPFKEVVKNPGQYLTSAKGMKVQKGRSYKISITVNNYKYESDWQKLNEPPTIDSIYIKNGSCETMTANSDGTYSYYNEEGKNAYLSLHPAPNNDYYYKIKSTSIQQMESSLYPQTEMGKRDTFGIQHSVLDVSHPLTVYTWLTFTHTNFTTNIAQNIKPVQDLFLSFEKTFNEKFIPLSYDFSFLTISPDDPRNRDFYNPKYDTIYTTFYKNKIILYNYPPPYSKPIYYSDFKYMGVIIIAEVYSVNKNVFEIFATATKQVKPQNSIFDPIPTQLSTNIKCLTDSTKKSFGYFAIASITRKSRYFMWNVEFATILPITKDLNLTQITKPTGTVELNAPDFWTHN